MTMVNMVTTKMLGVMVIQAAADHVADESLLVNELLSARTGLPLTVCDQIIHRAVRYGLVESGSTQSCRPTMSGLGVLALAKRSEPREP